MNRIFTLGAAVLILTSSALAQVDDGPFNKKQADRLNKFAKRAFKKGFPRQAKLIWLKAIKLYDEDSADAHKGLGHIKVGSSWNPDSTVDYPTTDSGTGASASSLYKAYEKMSKDLASAHRGQAQKWEKGGRMVKSLYHYGMVLRWVKDDKDAQAALKHREVGGVTGTELEETLYKRSKMIERAVEEQVAKIYDVKRVEGAHQAYLDAAQVKYITVESDHFVLHGDPEEELALLEALEWAERTLRVVEVAFPWQVPDGKWGAEWAYFVAKDTWKQVLKANAGLVRNLEWTLEYASGTTLSSSDGGACRVGATGSRKVLFDAVVRQVAQGSSRLVTDGFTEGIGHTFVGMMFNNNRLFAVDLEKQQGTTATEEDREYTSTDFDIWKTLALEMAWKMTGGVLARDLPFCTAATFTNEQRIKAWSFTDYMVRRDPQLLLDMDRLGLSMRAQRQIRPLDFEKNFEENHDDVTVPQLDKEWEDFWTEASPVLKAIRANTPPLKAMSKGVEKWLAALNVARGAQDRTPVTFSANLSSRCYDHAIYLKNNKKERGPRPEHRQSIELGGSHLGSMFAELAIVETKAKVGNAKKMFKRWLAIPGYRDVLLNSFLLTVGISVQGDIMVMNVVSGLGTPKRKAGYGSYPVRNAKGIPASADVANIGPELVELLAKNGHENVKTIGYPLTLHFGRSIQGNRHSYRCTVKGREGQVEGFMMLDDGKVRNTTAPGMVTFYPLKPLPRGDISVLWTWDQDDGPKRLKANFTTM